MKKKLLNVILSISLLFTMISINSIDVFADGHSHDGISDWTGVSSLPSTSGNYYLTNDITLSSTWTVPTGTTNLCLNGHVINTNDGSFNVITVPENVILNLYDCNSTVPHEGYVDANSLWHLGTDTGTSKTISGGIITGGLRGVFVTGTFNMYGGTIAGNKANDGNGHGGGIYLDKQSTYVKIINGTIENNYCNASGGAVQVNGTFIMSGGTIQNNKANNDGGGLSVNGNVTLTGTAKIINNLANAGTGGGVNYYGGSVTLGGSVQITGNKKNDNINNFCLFSPSSLHITLGNGADAPNEGLNVGIMTANFSVTGTTPATITTNGTANDVNYFFSDDTTYGVNFNTDHLELFKPSDKVHNKTQNTWHSTLADAIENALSGDVIKLWQNNNTEDIILPVGVTLYVKSSYTGNISVISGKVRVMQDVTGDFKWKYSVANAPVEDNPSSNSNHIVLNTGVGNVSTNN